MAKGRNPKFEFQRLAEDAERMAKEMRKAASEAAKGMAVEIISRLAYATPVDTSRALSNWQLSVGFPKFREVEPYYMGQAGSTKEASASETVRAAEESVKNKKPGQAVFITNNVDYMEYLAKGHSPQQGPGWIELIGGISEDNWRNKRLPIME